MLCRKRGAQGALWDRGHRSYCGGGGRRHGRTWTGYRSHSKTLRGGYTGGTAGLGGQRSSCGPVGHWRHCRTQGAREALQDEGDRKVPLGQGGRHRIHCRIERGT